MGYSYTAPLTFYEVGGRLSASQTLTTGGGNFSFATVTLPSTININHIESCYLDFVLNWKNTFAGANRVDGSPCYLRLYDTVKGEYKTVHSNIDYICSSGDSGYFTQTRVYGDTPITPSWLTAGRSYTPTIWDGTTIQDSIIIYGFQAILRILMKGG